MARWETHRSDTNADTLYGYARSLGMSIEVIDRPVDALCGAFGLTVAIEVKTDKGKLRPKQLAFLGAFKGAVRVWRTAEDVIETHRELQDQARVLRKTSV